MTVRLLGLVAAAALIAATDGAGAQQSGAEPPPAAIDADAAPMTLELVDAVDSLYPEGPVLIDGQVLVAEMNADRVGIVHPGYIETFWGQRGCGPTSVSRLDENRLIVTCHIGGYLAVVSTGGTLLNQLFTASDGSRLTDPNDSTSDQAGGVYFTNSGLFSPLAAPSGSILYVGSNLTVTKLVNPVYYANGITYDAVRNRLLATEHFGHRVMSFPVLGPGQLGEETDFITAATFRSAGVTFNTLSSGPDGLEFISDDELLQAIYAEGKLLLVTSDGEIEQVFDIDLPFITNIVLVNPDEIVVVGSFVNTLQANPGEVRTYLLHRSTDAAEMSADSNVGAAEPPSGP